MIKTENLCKKYGDLEVLRSISTQIKKGDVVALIGPSGGGKSTFLRCLNRLELADSGKIFIKGENILDKKVDINKIRQKVSMVFQHFNLFANKNVLENLILTPIKTGILSQDEAILKAEILLSKVGLVDKKAYMPHKLSGGQKQRVSIARALAMHPKILCYDEPTSALDPGLRDKVRDIILSLKNESMTQIVVTHDLKFAREIADDILKVRPVS